ncbi:MAG: DevR family CRISPR-associated autoregulator [Candidatus Brockarchaeota archaeon]|nr:DevR family CRISPR-associated autoregulator [Candidatus Brockarchaeota archaeon]
MVYLRVTGRALINVHSANAEGAVGNYMALSKMFVIRRRGDQGYEVSEEPVISGNMLKHWHAVSMVEILKSWEYEALCETCKRQVMYRSAFSLEDEFEYIKRCAIEDLHGFLYTPPRERQRGRKQGDSEEREETIRRESLVKFSFLVPVEDQRAEYSSVTFNRVVIDEKGSIPKKEQAMMVMKREHASGVYGLLCSMDLAFAGTSLSNPSRKLPPEDIKKRVAAAISALTNVLSGSLGAAQARSFPIIKVLELVCFVARKPIPNAVHGFYNDYAKETAKIIKASLIQELVGKDDVKVVVVGKQVAEAFREGQVTYEETETAAEAIARIAEVVNGWL